MEIAKDDMKMIPLYVVVTILTTSSLSRCASLSNLYWDKRSVAVRQGDTVNVTCFSHTAINHVKHGLRIIHKDWPDTPMWDSATATSSDDRYSVMYHTSGLMAVAQLTIRDVQRIDAGSIGCTEDSADRTVTYTTLTVSPGKGSQQGHGSPRERYKRDYDWMSDPYEYNTWDPGVNDDRWLTVCLPAVIIALFLLIMVCIIDRWRKKDSRTAIGSRSTQTVELTTRRSAAATLTLATLRSRAGQQQWVDIPSHETIQQLAARLIQERSRSSGRTATLRVSTPSVGRSDTDYQEPPPYAEALDTAMYPIVQHPAPAYDAEHSVLESPPAYITLSGANQQ